MVQKGGGARRAGLLWYLRSVAQLYRKAQVAPQGLEAAVLADGRSFRSRSPTQSQIGVVCSALRKIVLRPRECFRNSILIAMYDRSRRISYCEGFALQSGLPLPIHHAWCILDGVTVIDLTWRTNRVQHTELPYGDRIWGTTSGISYRGIIIPADSLSDLVTSSALTPLQVYLRNGGEESSQGIATPSARSTSRDATPNSTCTVPSRRSGMPRSSAGPQAR